MSPRVLLAVSECAPLVKTGGLADVAGSLPRALRDRGIDVRVLLPGYPAVKRALALRPLGELPAADGLPAARLLGGMLPGAVPAIVIDCDRLYDRADGPYVDARGIDWPDNAARFGLLGRVAARIGTRASPLDWQAQIVHANDWQAALAPAYLALAGDTTPSIVTIHNLAFQGLFERQWMEPLGLPASAWSIDGVEYYGRLSFLKAGLFYATAITTVSPNYAREIQSAPLGMGFEGLLATRRGALHGILNGIDTGAWDPSRDPLIAARYDAATLDAKAANKRALQARFGLPMRDDVPLFGCVTRLTHQKGVDVVAEVVPRLLAAPAQLVLVGSGDAAEETRWRALAAQHPAAIGVMTGFDEPLAHLVEAGADAFLMPSRFEPCGMNQMFSQRYGTPPVVHATGGLADSVIDAAAPGGSGFVFAPLDAATLAATVARAIDAWRDRARWRALQRAGMARDFSWNASAGEYARLYAGLLGSGSTR